MGRTEEKVDLVLVHKDNANAVNVFLNLGRAYLSDLPLEERERFLQSILLRQEEPDRWLLLLRVRGKHIGFVHMKIDKDERPGWGFILEFYIVPDQRRNGYGRRLFESVAEILRDRGVKQAWLLTSPQAELFWHSLGFRKTGETDKETGQMIMTASIQDDS